MPCLNFRLAFRKRQRRLLSVQVCTHQRQ